MLDLNQALDFLDNNYYSVIINVACRKPRGGPGLKRRATTKQRGGKDNRWMY
jgi:hypothetical protein